MKTFLWIGSIVATISLLMDSVIFFNSFINGERLHPQLADHWPMNVFIVGVFVYFLNKCYRAKKKN